MIGFTRGMTMLNFPTRSIAHLHDCIDGSNMLINHGKFDVFQEKKKIEKEKNVQGY